MSMPVAWTRGYAWMNGGGRYGGRDILDALEGFGYELGSEEAELFERGADCACGEHGIDDISPDAWAEQ